MIYEIRTYTLKPRSQAEVEKRYAEAYEYRKKYSQLAAFWHTEVGPLNEIVQVWPYTDLTERTRIRAEASKDPNWPPKIREFVIHQQVELVTPFSFVPEITPGTVGPIFEMRSYSLTPGSLPGVSKRWEGAIGARVKKRAAASWASIWPRDFSRYSPCRTARRPRWARCETASAGPTTSTSTICRGWTGRTCTACFSAAKG